MSELERPAAPVPDDERALRAAEVLARWLDGRFLDPLLGLLLPGVGDLLSSALGLYPVVLAWRRRAPRALLARMLLNLAVDAAGGSIPIVGDVWDFFFKAHARNHALLRARLDAGAARGHWSDTLVVAAAAVALVAALALPVVVALGVWRVARGALGR
ncbi:MAG TPA: DUF4112 domain-containing protein [Polyangia bacterium]|nr:DUF4112 domain-containing protein [Polyangia bacterium]